MSLALRAARAAASTCGRSTIAGIVTIAVHQLPPCSPYHII
ncbi:hypothetical protein L842_1814 [Mycobacterium intracellulare MIN_052511_1280]|nr:hypothetical protein L842_1814 [Mycobacterium intracellulare MIN_052511_1280]